MPVIHELPSHMADLIAAGEVVERPASVAKELVENAIDAGATRIAVEIENGGISYLRISDNGCGMSAEDAPVAFRRHATSKLRTEADLSAIATLGFRGEALAAIASVSKIDLFTKTADAIAGTHLHLEAGEITACEEAGCPDGTTIIVRELFYNTPARMKFLKKDFTEAGYVTSVVQKAALSHPEISFSLQKDGKQVFSTSGDQKLLTPVFSVFGKEMTGNMVLCEELERNGMRVWGYITKPHFCRPNRSMQHFFVNGRYVRSKLMQAALEEAYRNKIITGKYPSCALFLTLPYNLVDVNVHPAKTEVKFAQERSIFEILYIACKNTLEKNDNAPQIKAERLSHAVIREDHVSDAQVHIQESQPVEPPKELPDALPLEPVKVSAPVEKMRRPFRPPIIECDEDDVAVVCSPDTDIRPIGQLGVQKADPALVASLQAAGLPRVQFTETDFPQNTPIQEEQVFQAKAEPQTQEAVQPVKPSATVIGEIFHTYLLAQSEDALVLIDKHAAHERLLFNRMRQDVEISIQRLLSPQVVEMDASEAAAIAENMKIIEQLGFECSPFGENSFAIRALPSYLDAAQLHATLSEIAEKLMNNRAPTPDRLDDLIHTIACKAAIKAGNHSEKEELQFLCDEVLSDPELSCCPHGRPTVVRLTKYELDKMFKRVNQ